MEKSRLKKFEKMMLKWLEEEKPDNEAIAARFVETLSHVYRQAMLPTKKTLGSKSGLILPGSMGN